MRKHSRGWRVRAGLTVWGSGAFLFQGLGGCGNIGTIAATQTTVTTFDGAAALIQIIRGVILTPIDLAITNAVNNFVNGNPDE